MDKHGNLNEIEKTKLGIFLLNFRQWWKDDSIDSKSETIELINSFEDFRREIEKDD